MALTLSITSVVLTRRQKSLKILAAPTGNYTAGGDPIDLTTLTNPKFLQNATLGRVPKSIDVFKLAAGYVAEIVAGSGTTLATAFNLKIYSAPGTELAAGAYPPALLADNFTIQTFDDIWSS